MVNQVYKKDDSIIRVLNESEDKLLVIDCKVKKMPFYIDKEDIKSYTKISESTFEDEMDMILIKYDDMSQKQKNVVNKIYGSIAMIINSVGDISERNKMINFAASLNKVNSATIRNRLINYLIYQDIGILLPRNKEVSKDLSDDELNFRWALNKYYYKPIKLSLAETYRRMIKDKYTNEAGDIKTDIPTFRQFTYYYQKTVKQENLLISREGKGDFMRNKRALLGNGVREFCPDIGYGMFDSTILDIYLINDLGEVIGRPVMVACVDAYTSYCMGYWLGFEGGVTSLKGLVNNILDNKVSFCLKHNIPINIRQWNCNQLPRYFITDRGSEYVSETFSQITELGVEILNLPPYRPELKSRVEKFFDIIQSYFKKDLASKGVIFSDFQERGGVDYRKKACLTLQEFEKIMIYCVLKYNNGRVIDLPYDKVGKVNPFASDLWNYCLNVNPHNLIKVSQETANLTLMPRAKGKFKREGLVVNRLRYKNYDYIDNYLKGGEALVAFNPLDVSKVWLIDEGQYVEFDLIDNYFLDKTLNEVDEIIEEKRKITKKAQPKALESSIKLTSKIEEAVSKIAPKKVVLKNIRKHRKDEIKR